MARAIDVVLLDWGNTLMIDYGLPGPMAAWPIVDAVPGAREALRILGPRYHLLVATNADASGGAEVLAALARVGLDELIDGVVSSRDIGVAKPDSAFFAAALRMAFGRRPSTPERVVMVGDSWENDVVGASAAGLLTVWLNPSGAAPPGETGAPDACIPALRELPEEIERLERSARLRGR